MAANAIRVPFCARHALSTGKNLEEEFVKSGELRMVFLNFLLTFHPYAQKASEAVECAADQGRFREMYVGLFQEPSRLDVPDLVAHAEAVGLDASTFLACLEGAGAAIRVKADVDEGHRLGVSSTPSFFLGRRQASGDIVLLKRINGAAPIDVFRAGIAGISAETRTQPQESALRER